MSACDDGEHSLALQLVAEKRIILSRMLWRPLLSLLVLLFLFRGMFQVTIG